MNQNTASGDRLGHQDLELLAGFAEGSLSDQDSARAEALLASSAAAREVFADLVDAIEAVHDAGTAAQSIGNRTIGGHRRWWTVAAGLAAAASVALLTLMPRSPASVSERALRVVAPEALTNVAGWADRVWAVPRGESSSSIGVASLRIGVLWMDGRVAMRVSAAEEVAGALGEIEALLLQVPGSAGAVARLVELRGGGAAPSDAGGLEAAEQSLCAVLDCVRFEAGVWLEAARLWALSPVGGEELAPLRSAFEGLAADGPVDEAFLRRVTDMLSRADPPADTVALLVTELIAQATR